MADILQKRDGSHSAAIDKTSGDIRIQGVSQLISLKTPRAEVVSALMPYFLSMVSHGNGYEWIYFSKLAICFHYDQIDQISFVFPSPEIEFVDGYPTQYSSDSYIVFIRAQLSQQLDRAFETGFEEFVWGSVWATVDLKSGLPSAGIRYKS